MTQDLPGWGFEDSAFAITMKTLFGELGYVENKALHLYHKDECNIGTTAYLKNKSLFDRYLLVENNPQKVRKLINEFQDKRGI